MKKLVLVVLSIIAVSVVTFFTHTQRSLANGANFSIHAILPENQKTEGVSYFEFELQPDEEKRIEIEIVNGTSKEQTYSVEINTATTNMNGVIDYTKRDVDDTIPISIGDIASVEPEIKVPAGGTIKVPIYLKMPDTTFDGILLGGISVAEVEGEEESQQQVTNRFSYSIAIVLSQGEIEVPINLDLIDAFPEQLNRRTVISGAIQNSASTIVNELTVDARIYREHQDKPLFHRNATGLRMAPNSTFNFGVETENQALRPGNYRMSVLATSGEQEWEWSKDFEITATQAKKLNDSAVELEVDHTALYLWIAIGLIGTLLAVVILLLIRNRQKGKKTDEANNKA